MIPVGYFSEMKLYADNGGIKNNINDKINYNKKKVVKYLSSQKKIAGCPKTTIDCMTGDKIADSFSVYTDGEYEWCDFLIYHIEKYNIELPHSLIEKIEQM